MGGWIGTGWMAADAPIDAGRLCPAGVRGVDVGRCGHGYGLWVWAVLRRCGRCRQHCSCPRSTSPTLRSPFPPSFAPSLCLHTSPDPCGTVGTTAAPGAAGLLRPPRPPRLFAALAGPAPGRRAVRPRATAGPAAVRRRRRRYGAVRGGRRAVPGGAVRCCAQVLPVAGAGLPSQGVEVSEGGRYEKRQKGKKRVERRGRRG